MSFTNYHFTPPPFTATANHHIFPPKKLALLLDNSKSPNQILQIHAAILRHGHHRDPILNFKLQKSYSSLNLLNYSLALLNNTQSPNVYFWTSIIYNHAVRGFHSEAVSLYAQMLTQGVEPNAFTFSSILKLCPIGYGEMIHGHVIKFGLESDTYVRTGTLDFYAKAGDIGSARYLFDTMPDKSLVSSTAMVTCYAKYGDIDEAKDLFDGMVEKDVVCWNVIIDGYCQHGKAYESLELFRRMLEEKVKPNEVTVLSLLCACGQLGSLESGRWVHSYIKTNGIRVNIHVASALIDMYSKCSSLEDARLVFDAIEEKDVVVWNSMIVGYGMHGFGAEALQLFEQMCRMRYSPSDVTFIGVLSGCAHTGLVEEGRRLFKAMKSEYDVEPKVEHYGCMLNLLGRAGHLKEAYELVKSMTIEADPILWGTLLGACRLHNNIALGEEIVEILVSRNLADSGTFTLLSNIYAAAGNWVGVARMRSMMRDTGFRKEPGCSSIEVDNKVYEFLAGDLRHPRSKDIYIMLKEMESWLKAHGYTPETDVVLHDLEEAQKEQSLEVHSEKLALAFGLISTQPGSAIKIMKNLRVCSDCHAVTKLISKITGRKIVMRDRNRFHHFVNGSCSCGDYW